MGIGEVGSGGDLGFWMVDGGRLWEEGMDLFGMFVGSK